MERSNVFRTWLWCIFAHSCGVLVLIKDGLEFDMKSKLADDNGTLPFLVAEFKEF